MALGDEREVAWWGYRHINDSIIVKRYFSEQDIKEAKESDFVKEIFPPFIAINHTEALEILTKEEG